MPPQDVEYSDWRTYDGRDYRYVDIDGWYPSLRARGCLE